MGPASATYSHTGSRPPPSEVSEVSSSSSDSSSSSENSTREKPTNGTIPIMRTPPNTGVSRATRSW